MNVLLLLLLVLLIGYFDNHTFSLANSLVNPNNNIIIGEYYFWNFSGNTIPQIVQLSIGELQANYGVDIVDDQFNNASYRQLEQQLDQQQLLAVTGEDI